MSAEKGNRDKYLKVRLTGDELKSLQNKVSNSSSKKLSEYVRKMIFGKPIGIHYRNQSLDDFMTEMIALRTELNSIGNNYNQVVKRMHTLQHLEEIKTWLLLNESSKQILLNKITEIKFKINQINDKWLQ
jgi:hypothetical protein